MRIALAQLNPIVGDVAGNTALVLDAIEQARRDRADLLVTSELTLIGYPPRDLLMREGVVQACEDAVRRIAKHAGEMFVIVGHPRRASGGTRPLRNSASVCHRGKIIAVCDKQLLPGYDVFDEDRYFEPGAGSTVVTIAGQRTGVLICEDLWRAKDVNVERRYAIEPVSEVARQKCDVLITLHGSPFVVGKWARHIEQLREVAGDLRVPIVAVNQVGANDDLIFDGRSVVVGSNGALLSVSPGFESSVMTVDIPSKAQDQPSQGFSSEEDWNDLQREIFHALTVGLRDYCHKTGHQRVLIGLSGGIDSALVATLAAAALGAQNVHGVLMPSRYSSRGASDDASELAARLGVKEIHEAPIERVHQAMQATLDPVLQDKNCGIVDENVQARLRGMILMAMSNASPATLVLATSNKSEIATGYSTLYGDMCGAVAPLGDLTKTRIYQLASWINANHPACGLARPPIPVSSINKPPSAELRPNQTDQDTLPPYEVLDQIIERYIEREQSAQTIITETGLDEAMVRRWTKLIDLAEYKRNQAPVILKVTPRTFGPGRPMPIVMKCGFAIAPAAAAVDKLADESARSSAMYSTISLKK